MGLLRRMWSGRARRARAAEGAGDYRRAAALYAEADMPEEAANALLFFAARTSDPEERLAAYHDALRWLPEGHPKVADVQARIGLEVLGDAQRRGASGPEEKRRLEDAARRLEGAARWSEAATAFEILGRRDDMARCLEEAGDIERLEAVLDDSATQERRRRRMGRLMADHDMAMSHGARLEALAALREAVALAPDDRSVADLLRRLEKRMPGSRRLRLRVDGESVMFVGKLPATVGRLGSDIEVRGASVSRHHAEVELADRGVVVRDLDSRNGTLVGGLPIAGEVLLDAETEIGLGDDVALRVRKGAGEGVVLLVVRGLDRGMRIVAGVGKLRAPPLPAAVTFVDGHAVLHADADTKMCLGTQPCVLPVVLLIEDRLTVGDHRVEVSE